jgi:hypothetical protein
MSPKLGFRASAPAMAAVPVTGMRAPVEAVPAIDVRVVRGTAVAVAPRIGGGGAGDGEGRGDERAHGGDRQQDGRELAHVQNSKGPNRSGDDRSLSLRA